MSNINRHQLKRNELVDFVTIIAEWIRHNQNTFYTIAGSAAAAAILVIFFFARMHTAQIRASEKLSLAQGQLYGGMIEQGLAGIDEIITQYPRSTAADKARIAKAEALMDQKKYDEAEAAVLPVAEKGRPKTIRPIALYELGTIREDRGKLPEAIQTYNDFLARYPDNFLTPKVYESLARTYELNGSFSEAKTTYERIVALYPQSGWQQRAQDRIALLSPEQKPAAK